MLSKKRNDQMDAKTRNFLEGVLEDLEKASDLEKAGNQEEADQIVEELKSGLTKKIKNFNGKEEKIKHRVFDKSKLPAPGEYLIASEELKLKTFDDSCREMYLKVSEENAVFRNSFKDPSFLDIMWEECTRESALYYAIEDMVSGEYAGYIAVKNTESETWELAMELLSDFKYKGIGKEVIELLLEGLHRDTGETLFRARVDSDNYACQALMKKVGARTNGISEFLLHGEELEKFQKENVHLIDDKLRQVADEFCVDVEDLVGHVLEYLIDWSRDK